MELGFTGCLLFAFVIEPVLSQTLTAENKNFACGSLPGFTFLQPSKGSSLLSSVRRRLQQRQRLRQQLLSGMFVEWQSWQTCQDRRNEMVFILSSTNTRKLFPSCRVVSYVSIRHRLLRNSLERFTDLGLGALKGFCFGEWSMTKMIKIEKSCENIAVGKFPCYRFEICIFWTFLATNNTQPFYIDWISQLRPFLSVRTSEVSTGLGVLIFSARIWFFLLFAC